MGHKFHVGQVVLVGSLDIPLPNEGVFFNVPGVITRLPDTERGLYLVQCPTKPYPGAGRLRAEDELKEAAGLLIRDRKEGSVYSYTPGQALEVVFRANEPLFRGLMISDIDFSVFENVTRGERTFENEAKDRWVRMIKVSSNSSFNAVRGKVGRVKPKSSGLCYLHVLVAGADGPNGYWCILEEEVENV